MVVVRGVSRSKGKYFIARYGRDLNRTFTTYEAACKQRKEWEELYGIPKSGNRADRQGVTVGNFTVVGDTGENRGNDQKILVKSNTNGKYIETTFSQITSGNLSGNKGIGRKQRNNKSGYPGIYKDKDKWCARIGIDKVKYFLGGFETKEDAIAELEKVKFNYWENGVLPIQKSKLKNLPQGISKTKNGTYRVSLQRQGKRTRKTFLTLSEAIKFNNKIRGESK